MDHEEKEPSSYELVDEMGHGVSAVVYAAICTSMDPSALVIVAINCIHLDCLRTNLDEVRGEVRTISRLSHHPNILGAYCSFKVGQSLWLVKLFMSGDTLPSIMPSSFPYGFLELCVVVILRDTLSSLAYLRGRSHVHRYNGRNGRVALF
ncbi:unnamed protein product [Thlaspi arvense]|uniref:Protein kinase domain-containing protein n=1 Tax=Thlaspi arvense TaxID=13288 RepID=A0AAU9T9Q5_THLAR|nr:unnamed protein product [Thlaspi arvense]